MSHLIDKLFLIAAKIWIHIYRLFKENFGLHIRGIGFLLRRIRNPFVFDVHGRKFVFSPAAAGAYALMPAGFWNEVETHLFFENLFRLVTSPIVFVDIGSSIGEMVMDAANYPQVKRIVAFEPCAASVEALKQSVALNGYNHVKIIPKAVSNEPGEAGFTTVGSFTGSHIATDNEKAADSVSVTTLDNELSHIDGTFVMLIDVEGNELKVLQGGSDFIRSRKPLVIIFEYNRVSRRHFSLTDIRNELGEEYSIYRLRDDGLLDVDFSTTWNCVAVHEKGFLSKEGTSKLIFHEMEGKKLKTRDFQDSFLQGPSGPS